MLMNIYNKVFAALMKKPLKLWGISLLCALLITVAGWLFGVIPGVSLAIGLLLSTAMTLIFLRGYRGQEIRTLNLFDCFRDWKTIKRVLCGMGWMILWIFLWGLIPFAGPVFAIIRTYEYRLTPYILMQEPDVAPTDAIKVSRERTNGWKGKMFAADILVVAAIYVTLLVLFALSRIPYVGILFALVLFVFLICVIALIGLVMGLIQAAFYEEIENARNGAPVEPLAPVQPIIPVEPVEPAAEEPVEPATEEPVEPAHDESVEPDEEN